MNKSCGECTYYDTKYLSLGGCCKKLKNKYINLLLEGQEAIDCIGFQVKNNNDLKEEGENVV